MQSYLPPEVLGINTCDGACLYGNKSERNYYTHPSIIHVNLWHCMLCGLCRLYMPYQITKSVITKQQNVHRPTLEDPVLIGYPYIVYMDKDDIFTTHSRDF